jgi:hypothetical protein
VLNFDSANVPDVLRPYLPWLDRLVPGVQLRPFPPKRDGDRGDYLPRSATVPFHALPIVQGWLTLGNWSLASIPVDRRRLDEWDEGLLRQRAEYTIDSTKLHDWLRSPTGEPRLSYQWSALGYASLPDQTALALHWGPGSGKTRAAIEWALARVVGFVKGAQDVIVVTPSSVVRHWERQIRKWTTLDPFVWVAPSRRRKKDWSAEEYIEGGRTLHEPPIVIVGHENVVDFWEEKNGIAKQLIAGSVVVFDESHLFRGTKRWQAVPAADGGRPSFRERKTSTGDRLQSSVLSEIAKWAGPRIELTATPIGNRFGQLWVQLDLLDPGAWGSFYTWSARHANGISGQHGGWSCAGAANVEEHRLRVGHFFYEVPLSVSHAQLPPKRRETVYLPVSEQVQELGGWTRLVSKSREEGRGRELEIKLMQAASRKRRYVLGRVRETVNAGGKVVVLTGRRKDVDALYAGLTPADGVWWVHGDMSQDKRADQCAEYMAWRPEEHEGRGCVLIGTLDCLGIGIDLQDSDLLLIAMLPWTWDVLWQAENRVYRLGMTRKVLIEFVIAEGTIDEHVAQTFLSKLPAIGAATPDLEVAKVGESLRGMDDVEGLLDRIFAKLTGEAPEEGTTA